MARLVGTGHQLEAVELADGRRVACEARGLASQWLC